MAININDYEARLLKLQEQEQKLRENIVAVIDAGNIKAKKRYELQLNHNLALQQHLEVQRKVTLESNIYHKTLSSIEDKLAKQSKLLDKNVKLGDLLSGAASIFVKNLFKADEQATKLGKTLVLTKNEAINVRSEFAGMSRSIEDSFYTTDKLFEANIKLTEQLGLSTRFSKDINKEFIALTQRIGISEDSAAGLAKMALSSGMSLKDVKVQALGAAQALKSSYGININNKEVLEEVGKISGQLLANFKANPKALAEAVTLTKMLGTSLAQTKAQGEFLLNFESSIEAELKSELLLNKQLNLERARAAALAGDQKTLAEELSTQIGTYSDFMSMNVLQQKALAESMGLSSDQLADQLMKI